MGDTLHDISTRRSIRAFKPEQVSEDILSKILEAGKMAPSSMNRQPWHFTVIQNKDLLDRMVRANRAFVEASSELAKVSGWLGQPDYHNFYHAPTVILVSGDESNQWHVCDCALALENMSLAAHSLSIGSCIIVSGRFAFKSEKAREFINELAIPEGYIPLYALSVGYIYGENPNAPLRKENCVNYVR